MADCLDGAVLSSASHRLDGRGVGACLTTDSQTRQRDSFTPAAQSGLDQPSPQSIASAMRAI
jgi:hypothetical protein